MDFGLGLVLSFTDRSSAGINTAIANINRLSQTATTTTGKLGKLGVAMNVLGGIGRSLTASITAPVLAFLGLITKFGVARASFVEDMHLAFTSLMGDAREASDYMNKLMDFAKTTPYTYEGITSAAQTLMTYGIGMNDILDEQNGKFKGILQALGDFAGATGQGEASMVRIANILGKIMAEGKVSTMRLDQLQRQGIQVSQIFADLNKVSPAEAIGKIKSMNAVDFINDLSNAIENGTTNVSAMNGMMENMKQTWSGSKDTFVSSLKNAGLQLMGGYIDEVGVQRYQFLEDMVTALNNISASIKMVPTILQPVLSTIQSMMTKGSKMLLKFATAWGKLSESTKKSIGKLVATLVFLGPILLIISGIGKGLAKTLLNLSASMKFLAPTVLKLGILFGGMALAWKYDFAGIRTMTQEFVGNMQNSMTVASSAIDGSVDDMMYKFNELSNSGGFWDNMTIGIMKLQLTMRSLSEAWSGYTLSEDTFLKAKELGLLPLIEGILDFKYRMELFVSGFKTGVKEVSDSIKGFIRGLSKNAKGTIFETLLSDLETLFGKLTNNDAQAWYDFGESFGKFATKAVILAVALKGLDKTVGFLMKLGSAVMFAFKGFKLLGGVGKLIGSIFTKGLPTLTGLASKIGLTGALEEIGISIYVWGTDVLIPAFQGAFQGLLAFLGGLSAPVIGIIVAVVASVLAYAITHWEEFKAKIGSIWTTLKESFSEIWNTIKDNFASIVDNIKSKIEPLKTAFDNMKQKFMDFGDAIKGIIDAITSSQAFQDFITVLSAIGEIIVNTVVPAINGIINTIKAIATGIINVLGSVINGIITIVSGIVQSVMQIVGGFIDIITGLITGNFQKVGEGVKSIWSGIFTFIGSILSAIWGVIVSIFSLIVTTIGNILTGLLSIVIGIFTGIWNNITNILQVIFNVVGRVIKMIVNAVTAPFRKMASLAKAIFHGIYTSADGKFKAVLDAIVKPVTKARDKVKELIEKIKGFFKFKWSLPKLKMPSISISGKFSMKPPSAPKFKLNWYKEGGVFNDPSIIGVGENGKEAVMPLENNTGWIGVLASKIGNMLPKNEAVVPDMSGLFGNVVKVVDNVLGTLKMYKDHPEEDGEPTTTRFTPVANRPVTPLPVSTVTNNNSNPVTENTNSKQGDTINFNQGSIVINLAGSSEEDANKLVDMLLERIKRRKQIDDLTNYRDLEFN